MLNPLSKARETFAACERSIEPSVTRLLGGHPRPLVREARSFEEYRVAAERVAVLNGNWLRETWFRGGATALSRVLGYCYTCSRWTSFAVDGSVCTQWEGRPVPWWSNTLCCQDCRLVARMRAAVHLFEERIRPAADDEIYITEQTTPLYQQFKNHHPRLVGSEFLGDSTPRGGINPSDIRCEDLTNLTFSDKRFDHLLSFEVLEHIPDYRAALQECARVLKPGGKFICSAPFHGKQKHIIRARRAEDGSIEHLLPPEYHGDPINPDGVLCYRYFGLELLNDLEAAGFSDASAWLYWSADLGYLGEDRVVFVAIR
jgi:hypothetical protein